MTRAQHHPATRPASRPGTRPPTRRDTRHDPRRPGATPPRARRADPPPAAPAQTRPPAEPLRVPPQTPRRPVGLPQPRPTDVFADRLLLVLSGQRPVHFMLRHTLGRAYDDLARLAESGPLRSPGPRPVVGDVGWYEPYPGAFEAFARIRTGDRLRAMAFRLERGADHRWRCTAVELDGPRGPRAQDDG
ncbi:Rv3235 family protein [Streptomyces sp. JB150]|uniref:Rv3235 family protein n=1 Tax=Streptomyces sp. JB150 TaxID=2714844 RepID=UPI001F0F932F|nr:Rv3235 family protein [Streptomyces sp. JB150]